MPTSLEQLNASDKYRFCPGQTCSVIYFSEQGQLFTVDDLKVPVFQKIRVKPFPSAIALAGVETELVKKLKRRVKVAW
ncbi:MAG: hypothetical protein OHK0047_23020 [Leptolyngbyaceae cyanobacterium]